MCFSSESSLIVFSIGIACTIYLIYRAYKTNSKEDLISAICLILITIMQFIEYILWNNQQCNDHNRIASYFIIILLMLQPIVIYIVIYYLYHDFINNKQKYIIYFFLVITILAYIYYFLTTVYPDKKLCSLKDPISGRLIWAPFKNLLKTPLFAIFFVISYFLLPTYIINITNCDKNENIFRKRFILSSALIALIITILYYGKNFYFIFGSLWCYLAVAYGTVCILFPIKY